MKSTIVIYGSSTGSCQSIAETIASKLGVEAVDVANIDEATITSHENLFSRYFYMGCRRDAG